MNKNRELYFNQSTRFNEDNNRPKLFNKKIINTDIKGLIYLENDTGKTRHFTPAAQEWYNSIYSYNKNYIKSLTIADKTLINLLKSFFNSQIKEKLIEPMPTKRKFKYITRIYKPLSTKRIFIGKGELKHVSSKVIITFYVYNTESLFLSHKIKQLRNGMYFPTNNLKKTVSSDHLGKKFITYNRLFTLLEFLTSRERYITYISDILKYIRKQTSQILAINKSYMYLTNLVHKKILTKEEKLILFDNKFKSIYFENFGDNFYDYNSYIKKVKDSYKKNLTINRLLLTYNKAKFTKTYISKLLYLVQKIYKKKVEFNIVNLKKMHYNSDIYTQAISLKLRNRDNKLYRILKASLRKVKVINISKLAEKQKKLDRDMFIINKIRNNTISTMFKNNKNKNINDPLNSLLLKIFPSSNNLQWNVINKKSINNYPISLEHYVVRSLKHVKLRGIRVEAKGRLTRRFTASRSLFKMKWKGGLKNVESSFRGWSAIMLRGVIKSNIQYSNINSKNRNGAFGVKGWVSSY